MTVLSYFLPASPEVCLVFAALGATVAGLFSKGQRKAWLFSLTSLMLLAIAFGCFFLPGLRDVTFDGHFFNDSFSLFIKSIIALCAALLALNLQSHLTFFKVKHFEFVVLLLCAVLGMFILVSANDFLPAYIGLEIQSLALYVMIGLFHEEKNVPEAVLKYFILGAVASCFILFGISFIYGFSGTTNFNVLESLLNNGAQSPLSLYLGIAFLLCGLAFKVSSFPFHMWTPDVYQGTPYPLLVLVSTAPKIAALGFMMRLFLGPFYTEISTWQPLLMILAVASMVFGAVASVMQGNVRRFLAYASISSIGFSLVGLAFANESGLRGSLFYTTLYIFSMIGFLTCVMILLRRGSTIDKLSDLKGLATQRPFVAIAIAILVLTMSGLPPFPGFLGKLLLLQAAVGSEFYNVAIVMVLTTVITTYYYLNILKIMFFDGPVEPSILTHVSGKLGLNYLIVILSISLLTGLIFLPKYLLNWTNIAASTLFYT